MALLTRRSEVFWLWFTEELLVRVVAIDNTLK